MNSETISRSSAAPAQTHSRLLGRTLPSFLTRPRFISAIVICSVIVLFGLSVARSYLDGQMQSMYDNPIYRWRESLAVALSRMQAEPLSGYLAYRSISNYLNHNGLGLAEDETSHLPTAQERHDLVFDGRRMQDLIRAATRTPIDDTLPPVTINGNEKGLADFYYLSFKIFGLKIVGFTLLYYSILAASVLLFFYTFRASPFCLLLLMVYLIGHIFMVGYANHPQITTVHNSRFFPVLAVLPAMHLFLMVLRGTELKLRAVCGAAMQTFFLFFMMLIREQVAWQAVAVIASPLLVVNYRALLIGKRWPRLLPTILIKTTLRVWPAALVFIGLIGFFTYQNVAFDKNWYGSQTTAHLFWHPLYAGMISASPELSDIYLHGEDAYGDNLGYQAVLSDLRRRNEVPPEVAYIENGEIWINPNWNSAVYDRLVRRVFFQTIFEHPFLAIKSFIYDKPRDQFAQLSHVGFFRIQQYLLIPPLAVFATLVAFLAGASLPNDREARFALLVVLFIVVCSSATTLVVPSILIVDTIIIYLMLLMLALVFVPLSLFFRKPRTEPQKLQ